ncbi:hypothetical protein DAPPUDRAFT_244546 [Daphnia pulex]|uniref:Uncharacterized protein n=1 Tax=Daphnia pulex TaxID=6669 RepID=E9GL68_DAPPU|nr:hypothetical protein DAPPUDRAFT_244546 [Daphnia pulex]|eukprot:EFX79802.1 hypothetical protein DAPPUDRAFT_244546 [Daphnia pulex]
MPTPYYTTTAYASAGEVLHNKAFKHVGTYSNPGNVNLQKEKNVTICYYNGASNYYTEKAEYYTRTCATPVYYIEIFTTLLPYYSTSTYAVSTHYIDACKYHISKATRVIYTNIYASSSYCTEVSFYPKSHQQNEYYTGDLKYYTTKATKHYTEAAAY